MQLLGSALRIRPVAPPPRIRACINYGNKNKINSAASFPISVLVSRFPQLGISLGENFPLSFLPSWENWNWKWSRGHYFFAFISVCFVCLGFIAVRPTRSIQFSVYPFFFCLVPGTANKYHKNSLPVPSGISMNFSVSLSRIEKNFPRFSLALAFFLARRLLLWMLFVSALSAAAHFPTAATKQNNEMKNYGPAPPPYGTALIRCVCVNVFLPSIFIASWVYQ